MSNRTDAYEKATGEYVRGLAALREPPLLAALRAETATLPEAIMQISPEQGQFMALLIRALDVRRAIEVGVFTGYSALCVARELPADGRLVACDVSDEWTAIGRRYWAEAGVADRIDLRLGPAADTLAAMVEAGEAAAYDFAFIDADKQSYDRYYELCLTLVRPGGMIAIDNIFLHGRALSPETDSASGKAIHALTRKIFDDDRVDAALVPIGDGVLLATRR
jgi:predicted O-methyltransferase YrrM